jgi:hypothetical protein
MADLPPGGVWGPLLVGYWWPGSPDAPARGVQYWRQQQETKYDEGKTLKNAKAQLLSRNGGKTADDLATRYVERETKLNVTGDQCFIKSERSAWVVNYVNNLRSELADIAEQGRDEIEQIIANKDDSIATKVTKINAVIAAKNGRANHKGGIAMGKHSASTLACGFAV